MTRDEAIATAGRHELAGSIRLVDCLVALGILKLNEPKSTEQRVLEIISQHVTANQYYSIKGAIRNAGVL